MLIVWGQRFELAFPLRERKPSLSLGPGYFKSQSLSTTKEAEKFQLLKIEVSIAGGFGGQYENLDTLCFFFFWL